MLELGTCAECHRMWYSIGGNGKLVEARYIPTCPEGSIMAVCTDCFEKLPSATIIALACRTYVSSSLGFDRDGDPKTDTLMSGMDNMLVTAAITGWVKYMKGDSEETPWKTEHLEFH